VDDGGGGYLIMSNGAVQHELGKAYHVPASHLLHCRPTTACTISRALHPCVLSKVLPCVVVMWQALKSNGPYYSAAAAARAKAGEKPPPPPPPPPSPLVRARTAGARRTGRCWCGEGPAACACCATPACCGTRAAAPCGLSLWMTRTGTCRAGMRGAAALPWRCTTTWMGTLCRTRGARHFLCRLNLHL
jgi:hypothetical protein